MTGINSWLSKVIDWLIYEKPKDSYPFWLFIEKEKDKFMFLKAKEKWLGPGKNIFCKFEGEVERKNLPRKKLVDSCKIFSLSRYGKKLNIVLERLQNNGTYGG